MTYSVLSWKKLNYYYSMVFLAFSWTYSSQQSRWRKWKVDTSSHFIGQYSPRWKDDNTDNASKLICFYGLIPFNSVVFIFIINVFIGVVASKCRGPMHLLAILFNLISAGSYIKQHWLRKHFFLVRCCLTLYSG